MLKYKKFTVKDFGDVVTGSTPSTTKVDYWNGDIPFYSPADFTENIYCYSTEKTITELGLKQGRTIPTNSVMVTCIASIGKMAINNRIGITNQQINTIIPYEQFDYKYLYYLINQNIYKLANIAPQTAVPIINKTEFEKTSIIGLLDKTQQKKIADILSTCDEVIEKTKETIEKYKQIKAGMMQDLFTRGLDENGKLRPTYAQALDLYKYSKELDRYIPKDWDVNSLSILGEFKNGLNKEKKCFGHGTKFVNIIDAYKEYLDIGSLDRVETNNNDLLIYSLKNNDLVFVRSSVKPEGVGYNTIFLGADEPIVYCGFMIRFRLYKSDNINAQFLNYYFRSDYFRRTLIAKSTVSANTNINQDSLNQLYTVLPKEKEQNKIVVIIDNINKNISSEEQYLNKYKQIKQGLMKRLLTPPADAEIVEE